MDRQSSCHSRTLSEKCEHLIGSYIPESANHPVGPMALQFAGVAAIHPEYQAESPEAACLHAHDGILDNGCSLRLGNRCCQPGETLEKNVWLWLAAQPQTRAHDSIHDGVEKILDASSF